MEPIVLKYPFETTDADGKKYTLTSVTPRRAKARDLRNLPPGAFTDYGDNPNAQAPTMIALCCGITLEAAEEIDIEDVFEIMKVMPSLMPGFSGTGEKSSGESPESTTSPQT